MSEIIKDSNIVIKKIADDLDKLLVTQFIQGWFLDEYKDVNFDKYKTYKALRSSGFVPSPSSSYIRHISKYKNYFSLYQDLNHFFNTLEAQKKDLNENEINQLISILESIEIDTNNNNLYDIGVFKTNTIEQLKKCKINLIAQTPEPKLANENSIVQTPKPTSVVKEVTTEISSVQTVEPKQVVEQLKPAVETVAPKAATPVTEISAAQAAKSNVLANLENKKAKINSRWHALVANKQDPIVITENMINTVVNTLDEFIKDKFILKIFADDFNIASKNIINEKGQKNKKTATTYEQDFAARGIKTNFTYYQQKLFTKNTFGYLMNKYPNDFLAFRQMVNLLEEIKSLKTKDWLPNQRMRKIFDCFNQFTQANWVIDANVQKTISPELLLAPTLAKFSNKEHRENANLQVLDCMELFLTQLQTDIDQLNVKVATKNVEKVEHVKPSLDANNSLKTNASVQPEKRTAQPANNSSKQQFFTPTSGTKPVPVNVVKKDPGNHPHPGNPTIPPIDFLKFANNLLRTSAMWQNKSDEKKSEASSLEPQKRVQVRQ